MPLLLLSVFMAIVFTRKWQDNSVLPAPLSFICAMLLIGMIKLRRSRLLRLLHIS
jgi:hypothetical protein